MTPQQLEIMHSSEEYIGTRMPGVPDTQFLGLRAGQLQGKQRPFGFEFNKDDWFENYGPLATDMRHVLNLSALVDLSWRSLF